MKDLLEYLARASSTIPTPSPSSRSRRTTARSCSSCRRRRRRRQGDRPQRPHVNALRTVMRAVAVARTARARRRRRLSPPGATASRARSTSSRSSRPGSTGCREQRHVRNAARRRARARLRRHPRDHAARPAGRSTTRPTAAAPGWSSASTWSRRRSRPLRRRGLGGGSGGWSRSRPAGGSSTTRSPPSSPPSRELTLLCGRYEGFDERVNEHLATDVVSIGPYVLAGGELAAMVVCDAVIRKLPGALGHADSARRGVVQRRARGRPRVPALHATGRVARPRACPTSCSRGDHARVARMAAGAEPRARPSATLRQG